MNSDVKKQLKDAEKAAKKAEKEAMKAAEKAAKKAEKEAKKAEEKAEGRKKKSNVVHTDDEDEVPMAIPLQSSTSTHSEKVKETPKEIVREDEDEDDLGFGSEEGEFEDDEEENEIIYGPALIPREIPRVKEQEVPSAPKKNAKEPKEPKEKAKPPKSHKYSMRVQSSVCAGNIIQYIMTHKPMEQHRIMNSMAVRPVSGAKSSERDFVFMSILSHGEILDLMHASYDPMIISAFHPENLKEVVSKPRKGPQVI
jgi:hypothetical protein